MQFRVKTCKYSKYTRKYIKHNETQDKPESTKWKKWNTTHSKEGNNHDLTKLLLFMKAKEIMVIIWDWTFFLNSFFRYHYPEEKLIYHK